MRYTARMKTFMEKSDTNDVLLICPREDDKFKPFLSDLALPDYKEFK